MSTFIICFEVTGGISVEANTVEEALEYFESESGQEAVGMCLSRNEVTIIDIHEERMET